MNTSMSDISRSSLLVVSLSVVAEAATAIAPTTPAPADVTTTKYMEPVRLVQFNPALAAVIVAMIIGFFLVGFATGFLKRCIRPAEADDEIVVQRRIHSGTGSPTSKSQRGLDPEILEALPLIQYKDLPADEQVRKYFDCPVCLAAFDANDSLRLLPECSHAFHSDCIDVWFLSHSTCPLCRACLALPRDKASREEREGNADAGEQSEIRVPEGFDVLEMVISGDREQDSSGCTAISGFFQDRTGRVPMANSFAAEEEEERINAHFVLWSNARASFRPSVRVDIAPDKAAALATIRRSNSAGTELQLLHPSYVVHSEGTQHNRNYLTHAIDVEEFLSKDKDRAQAQSTESPSRRPVTLAQHWLPVDLEAGPSSVTRPISRFGPQRVWSTRWSFPNLQQIPPA